MNSVKDFRGKIEPPVERGVPKIERYAQRLTQGYSAHGGSYLWAPDSCKNKKTPIRKTACHMQRLQEAWSSGQGVGFA